MNQNTQLRDLEEHDSNFYEYESLKFYIWIKYPRYIIQYTLCLTVLKTAVWFWHWKIL